MAEHPPIEVVGFVGGECFGAAAQRAVERADVLVGTARHLERIEVGGRPVIDLVGPLPAVLDRVADARRRGQRVTVIASGDPGFYGIARTLARRFDVDSLRVHPAPSSVALAFARLAGSWEDATVVSAHGRPLPTAVARAAAALRAGGDVALLSSPENPPQRIVSALLDAGALDAGATTTVAARLGEADEAITRAAAATIAGGTFPGMAVVIVHGPGTTGHDDVTAHRWVSWALPEDAFEHRAGMITKAEIRALVLARLALPERGVLWDVGAGSGSVAIEAARLRPGLRVLAVERGEDDCARIRRNAARHGVAVEVVHGEAPAVLEGLADPDRVFIGGGGPAVLDACHRRLRPGGSMVCTFALVDRAADAWKRLGHLVQLQVARGVPVTDQGVRLAAENPVFVVWSDPPPAPAEPLPAAPAP